MFVSIEIDFSDVNQEFGLNTLEEEKLIDYAIKALAAAYLRSWDALAKRKLKSTRDIYRSGLSIHSSGIGEANVKLKGVLPNMIEQGASPFDMKVGFLRSSKVKINRNGSPYITIPFRHAIPGSLGESAAFANVMPGEIYSLAKVGRVKESDVPDEYKDSYRPTIDYDNKFFEEYQHKSSIYAGMKRIQTGLRSGQYIVFRRVSEKSDSNAFIHPGIDAFNLSEEALESSDIPGIVDRATDEIVSQIR